MEQNERKVFSLDSEIQSEFYVTEKRKKLWFTDLKLMEWFSSVCDKYDLSYFILAGCSLGAIRHKGFIPWDDDMDIGMLREDFDRFREVAEKELPTYYSIDYGVLKNNLFSGLLRIRDNRTTGIIVDEYEQGGAGGIFIEIYPFDRTVKGGRRNIQLFKSRILFMVLNYYNRPYKLSFVKRCIMKVFKCIPISLVWKMYEHNNSKYRNRETEYVDTIALPSYALEGIHLLPNNLVSKTCHVDFENIKVRIPEDYDTFLKQQYGDYMQLPSVEERGRNHENIVFYDPDKPYDFYDGRDEVKRYFNGEDNSIL